jgi:rhamnogalacturonyl hydrolase YesR
MVPPSLAFAAVLQNNQSLLSTAYQQCNLYRQGLRQPAGLWAHIVQGSGTSDPGLWATGNAWAAYGMLRVWATIYHSPWRQSLTSEMSDLQSWTTEILANSRAYLTPNGLLRNYINDPASFEDCTGSALISAAAFRLSTLNITNDFVPMAISLLSAVSSQVNSTGYVNQVTDPYSFSRQGDMSPEAQSFVVLAYEAYKDWETAGKQGAGGKDLGKDSSAAKLGAGWLGLTGMVVGGLIAAST